LAFDQVNLSITVASDAERRRATGGGRRASQPGRRPGPQVAAVKERPFAFWGGEFAALLVPGTDPSPDPDNPNTFPLMGRHVHGNLFFSAVNMVLSLLGALVVAAA